MRTVFTSLVLAVVLAGAARAGPATDTVDYRLSPEFHGEALSALKVEISLHADASGRTTLRLPDSYGSGKEFWRNIDDLRIEGASAVDAAQSDRRVIHSAPGAALAISYRLTSPDDHDPKMEETERFEPVIRPTWFYVFGPVLFAYPDGREASPARFDWADAPAGFKFASDLEHMAGEARPALRPGTVHDIIESAVIGGRNLTVVSCGSIRFAAIGAYRFTPEQALDLVARVQRTENGFWRDPTGPYLATMGPIISPGPLDSMWEGDGLGDGFFTRITPDLPLAALRHFFAHENFHTWNGRQLGATDHGREGLGFWLSEGVSDFYARRLLLRSGIVTRQEFADIWNEMLVAYAASPVREAPNSRVATDFFRNPDVQKLPYQRGAMLAAIWDTRLRSRSHGRVSLDTVLRAQRQAAKAEPTALRVELFPRTAARYGLDVRPDLARFVDSGAPIVLPQDAFGPCFRVAWREQPTFGRGWDLEATRAAGDVIAGVPPGSPAYRAGLRDGMKVLERVEGGLWDAAVRYGLRVRTADGTERVIRYMPEGPGKIRVQRLTPTPHAANCRGQAD